MAAPLNSTTIEQMIGGIPGVGVFGLNTNQSVNFSGFLVDKSGNVTVPGNFTVTGTTFTDNEATTLTTVNANAFVVGANGNTNPVLKIDTSVTSQVTGIQIQGRASGNGVAILALSSATNESITLDSKGSSNIAINANGGTGQIYLGQDTQLADGKNLVLNTTTGTQIGTGATQKIGFFGATPIVQPASPAANTTTTAAGSVTNVFVNTTFTGGNGSTAYTVGDIVAKLKALGLLAV